MEKELRIIISGGGTGWTYLPCRIYRQRYNRAATGREKSYLWEPRAVWRCSGFPMQAIRLSGYR